MKDESLDFTVINAEGKEIECEALATFQSEITGKMYILYTDNTLDEEGNTKVYASIFDETNPQNLQPIETEEEWNMVDEVLSEICGDDDDD